MRALSYWRFWRERGWSEIDATDYAACWSRYGGSVATHPTIVARLSTFAGIPVRYLGWRQDGQQVGAIPTWGRYVALAKGELKRRGLHGLFDVGDAELIFPMATHARVPLRHRAKQVSMLHAGQITSLRVQRHELALLRRPEDYSGKFRKNQQRMLRLLLDGGGRIDSVHTLSANEQARIYAGLFRRRWGFEARGVGHLAEVFALLREFLFGSVVYSEAEPVAIDICYRVEAPQWHSVECVNGGVSPEHRRFSPGSVLSLVNAQQAWREARVQGKDLRYSFGYADREYKDRLCHRVKIYRN